MPTILSFVLHSNSGSTNGSNFGQGKFWFINYTLYPKMKHLMSFEVPTSEEYIVPLGVFLPFLEKVTEWTVMEERSYKNSQTQCCSGIITRFYFRRISPHLKSTALLSLFPLSFTPFVPFAKVSSRHGLRKPNAAVRDSGRSVIVLGHCDLWVSEYQNSGALARKNWPIKNAPQNHHAPFCFSSFFPLISTFHLSLILSLRHTLGLIKPVINILSYVLFFRINKNAEAKIAILLGMMCFWQFEKSLFLFGVFFLCYCGVAYWA